MLKDEALKRYWFIVYPEDRYGPRNIGVTAYSLPEAKDLIIDTFTRCGLTDINRNILDHAEVVENIDVRILDQGHVVPNMGVVIFNGIWFPYLNL